MYTVCIPVLIWLSRPMIFFRTIRVIRYGRPESTLDKTVPSASLHADSSWISRSIDIHRHKSLKRCQRLKKIKMILLDSTLSYSQTMS